MVVDLPFLTYQINLEEAVRAAGRMLKEAGAQAVKLERGPRGGLFPWLNILWQWGIPVMGHVGLTPQSVHQFGGFSAAGEVDCGGRTGFLSEALALEQAGAFCVVLEHIPCRTGDYYH